ncbi:MAG: hypothetical protein HQ546_00315 [Planctomycetes bacterium]|nr:hypothetical protein [Planctomycetota bacterium]
MPAGVINRARTLLPELQAHLTDGLELPGPAATTRDAGQLDLFADTDQTAGIIHQIKQAALESMTALEALDLLRKLKGELP